MHSAFNPSAPAPGARRHKAQHAQFYLRTSAVRARKRARGVTHTHARARAHLSGDERTVGDDDKEPKKSGSIATYAIANSLPEKTHPLPRLSHSPLTPPLYRLYSLRLIGTGVFASTENLVLNASERSLPRKELCAAVNRIKIAVSRLPRSTKVCREFYWQRTCVRRVISFKKKEKKTITTRRDIRRLIRDRLPAVYARARL